MMQVLANGDCVVKFRLNEKPTVVRNDKQVGTLSRLPVRLRCRNDCTITSRYVADSGDAIYYLDNYHNLVRYSWHDILDNKFDNVEVIAKQVVDFALDNSSPVILF